MNSDCCSRRQPTKQSHHGREVAAMAALFCARRTARGSTGRPNISIRGGGPSNRSHMTWQRPGQSPLSI